MEIIGDDKKLRALYSDAKVADQSVTPGFSSVWHRAQARSLKPRRAVNLSLALVAALLVLTLGSLAVWSMYSPRRTSPNHEAGNGTTPGAVTPRPTEEPKVADEVKAPDKEQRVAIKTNRRSVNVHAKRSVAPSDAPLIASTKGEQVTIETWQSPTTGLLSSPTDGLFKSLPQLNENANEMKSLLPGRSNEKEK